MVVSQRRCPGMGRLTTTPDPLAFVLTAASPESVYDQLSYPFGGSGHPGGGGSGQASHSCGPLSCSGREGAEEPKSPLPTAPTQARAPPLGPASWVRGNHLAPPCGAHADRPRPARGWQGRQGMAHNLSLLSVPRLAGADRGLRLASGAGTCQASGPQRSGTGREATTGDWLGRGQGRPEG